MSLRVVALGLAGLAVAALLGFAGYLVGRDTIALPATSLSAGEGLAPAISTPRQRPTVTARTQPATTDDDARGATTTTTTTTTTGTTTAAEDDDDRGRGRGRNRGRGGGDDD